MSEFENITSKSYGYRPTIYASSGEWRTIERLYENNYVSSNGGVSKIPKIIHQIWLGGELPEKYKQWIDSWKKFHPDWEYKLWRDEDVEKLDFPFRKVYNEMSNYGVRSDILRYYLLYKFGGLYADTDFECLKSFDSLTKYDFVSCVGFPSNVEIYVGLMLSVPGHPILKRVLEKIQGGILDNRVFSDILSASSSRFFTDVFLEVIPNCEKGVVILPFSYFYPLPNNLKKYTSVDIKPYLTENSFAVHYWEVSWSKDVGGFDWIQGEKFKRIADFTYSPKVKEPDDYDKLPNTFNPAYIREGVNIIYTHTIYVKKLLNIIQHLPGKFVIISHNGDVNIDSSYVIPDNVIKWFSQNVSFKHPKLESIPIGIQNNIWLRGLGNDKKNMIHLLRKKEKSVSKLAYLCCMIKTNPQERLPLYEMFENNDWMTVKGGEKAIPPRTYLLDIYSHDFVLCPDGNGIDTHRIWETLYLNSIPIVKRSINTDFYKDLPICFVNDWSEVTESFLLKEKQRIRSMDWDRSKLNFTYWKKKILIVAGRYE